MDAYRNPYTPGAGSRPAALTGRDKEIDRFGIVLGRLSNGAPEQGLVIHGLRGVGKTVLLNKLEEVAIEASWATSFGEIRRGDDFRAVMARALFNAIRQLDARRIGGRAIDRLKSAFASFSATVTSNGEIRFGFELDPASGAAHRAARGARARGARPRPLRPGRRLRPGHAHPLHRRGARRRGAAGAHAVRARGAGQAPARRRACPVDARPGEPARAGGVLRDGGAAQVPHRAARGPQAHPQGPPRHRPRGRRPRGAGLHRGLRRRGEGLRLHLRAPLPGR